MQPYIKSLHRYPVKSMQGESVASLELGERGFRGDRILAIRDLETGYIASAKLPRKWGKLLHCRAQCLRDDGSRIVVEVTFPGGDTMRSDDAKINATLADLLERKVELVNHADRRIREADRAALAVLGDEEDVKVEAMGAMSPEDTFFDFAAVHIISQAEIGSHDVRRFRPNVVIEAGTSSLFDWLGSRVDVGDQGARLQIIDPTPRCIITTLSQYGVSTDRTVLREIHSRPKVKSATVMPGVEFSGVLGVYGTVAGFGKVAVGDKFHIGT